MALILGTKIAEHDATFALVKDGRVLRVYEEERFNFIKHGQSCMAVGLNEVLEDSGYTVADIDYISSCIDPSLKEQKIAQIEKYLRLHQRNIRNERIENINWSYDTFRNLLIAHTGMQGKIRDVRHHCAHMAGVYYPSNSSDAAIISIDGGGEAETIVLAHGKDSDIKILRHNNHPHSVGHLYLAVTNWLGWGYGEEGKTMALASYGQPRYVEKLFNEFIEVSESGFLTYTTGEFSFDAINRIFGPGRNHSDEITQTHKDVAATIQHITNQVMLKLSQTVKKATNAKTLIITGGVALNSVANGQVMKQKLFDEVLVFPHANDAGTAIGGALWLEYSLCGRRKDNKAAMTSAYYGREIDLHNIKEEAHKYNLSFQEVANPEYWASSRIAGGKIVGWIQGRAEIGPRALGNRSILANPQIEQMKTLINKKIKNRELWRPFAPSVLAEDSSKYFETNQLLPYMVIVADVKKEWASKLPAITHVDGTARVQSVEKEVNPIFFSLLREMKARTGIGMVLNTSFNDRGEPVVNTIDQALRLFLRSEMDALVIGNYVFENKKGAVRDLPAFSPFLFSLEKIASNRSFHLTKIPEGMPTKAFERFFQVATEKINSLTIDPDILSMNELNQYTNHSIPVDWRIQKIPEQDSSILVLGPRGGYEWAFSKRVFESEALAQILMGAEVGGRDVFGIDTVGGITNLEIIKKITYISKS